MKPLEGMLVLDFSQFLSGPYAGLRLAELGAHVLKIENPSGGDLYRLLSISDLRLDGEQPLFHAANHGKESLAIIAVAAVGTTLAFMLKKTLVDN